MSQVLRETQDPDESTQPLHPYNAVPQLHHHQTKEDLAKHDEPTHEDNRHPVTKLEGR